MGPTTGPLAVADAAGESTLQEEHSLLTDTQIVL